MYKIARLIKKLKPDIVHAHEIYTWGVYAGFYHRTLRKIPLVITPWGFHHIWTSKSLQRKLEKLAMEEADAIVVQGKSLKTALQNAYDVSNDKFVVFHFGVDTKLFHSNYEAEVKKLKTQLAIPKAAVVVISPRVMGYYWGIQYIISAIPAVVKAHPNTVFIFLRAGGVSKFENEMRSKVRALGVMKHARFISDFVPQNLMPIYLNAADISVMVPKTDQASFSLLEAMACGAIPIVTDLDSNREWIQDGKNGFLVPWNTPSKLAARINYCIEHPELKSAFYKTNKRLIHEKGDWNKNAKKMEELYLQLLSKNY
jgi:glycosyltransferase involved in cell wall biosynthesis